MWGGTPNLAGKNPAPSTRTESAAQVAAHTQGLLARHRNHICTYLRLIDEAPPSSRFRADD